MTAFGTLARIIDENIGDFFTSETMAKDAITALAEAGFAIVPREPTEAMLEVGIFEAECCTDDWTAKAACLPGHVWKAMVRAA